MPTPDKPSLDYSYTAFQESQGDNAFPGTYLDNDLANLKEAIDETIDFVGGVIRDDGKLQNAVVTKSSLDSTLLLGIATPTAWSTGVEYAKDATVFQDNTLYIATAAHVSGVFASDLSAGLWAVVAAFNPASGVADGEITTVKLAALAVTTAKLADLAVTTAKLADLAVTKAKLAAALQVSLLPIGGELQFSGLFAPSGFLKRDGSAVSRVTYLDLMNVLAPAWLATVSSGSNTVTNVPVDLRGLGLEGKKIEGSGIPAGATIASVAISSLTLSTNATASFASTQIRVFPHGSGDGSTTFNLPASVAGAIIFTGVP